MENTTSSYYVPKIKEKRTPTITKVINGKKYRSADKLRIYIQKKSKRPVKREDNSEYIKKLISLYKSVGIETEEEQKAMSCLLYRFKRCNPYYNMLVTVYLEDNSRRDFFNACYMVYRSNEVSDFKQMYKDLQHQLELETAITRKQKAKQVYKPLSLDEMRENGREKETERRHKCRRKSN